MAIPVNGDQPANADFLNNAGIGEKIRFHSLSEENLYQAIQKVLSDPTYKDNAEDLGSLLVDQIDKVGRQPCQFGPISWNWMCSRGRGVKPGALASRELVPGGRPGRQIGPN